MRPQVSRTVPGQIHMMVKVVVVMMSMKKSLQQFNDFIIWVCQRGGIQAEHLGHHHLEIHQLKNEMNQKLKSMIHNATVISCLTV